MPSKNFLIYFSALTSPITAGVLDIDIISTNSFSIPSCSLDVYDSIVYHLTKGSTALDVIQVDDPKSCSPVSGGYSFPQTPQNGSVYVNFPNPGTFYITTVEGCASGQISTVNVAAPPVNPYTSQAKVLIEQISKSQQYQHSSAASFHKSLVLFVALGLTIMF